MEFRSVTGLNEAEETVLHLKQGRLVVEPVGHTVVENLYGAKAEATAGLMGVFFSEQPFRFDVDCLAGECQVYGDLEGELTLAVGQHTFVGGSGQPAAAEPAHYELYAALSGKAPTTTPTFAATLPPTNTPTPSPIPTASRTPAARYTPRPTQTPSLTPTKTWSGTGRHTLGPSPVATRLRAPGLLE